MTALELDLDIESLDFDLDEFVCHLVALKLAEEPTSLCGEKVSTGLRADSKLFSGQPICPACRELICISCLELWKKNYDHS